MGSSSSATFEGARKEAIRIFGVAESLGWIGATSGWATIVAQRVRRPQLATVGDGLATFGGFHRSGWSLAPLRAAQLIVEIEKLRA